MNTENTAVTVIERAAVALGSSKAEAELTALAAKSKDITDITNGAGREECHAAAMVAKQARIAIEKTAKTAREDATLFSKAVIAEGSRLVALIEPEESRLIALRDEWDSAIAREKAAKAEAERVALAWIKSKVDNIKAWPVISASGSPAAVLDDIERLEAMDIDDSFGASYGEAVEAKAESLAKLREIHAAKVAAEKEAARVRDELAAQAERNRIEREDLDRQRAEQDKLRAEQNRLMEVQREEIARQQKVIEDQIAEQARIRKEAQEKIAAAATVSEVAAEVIPAPVVVAQPPIEKSSLNPSGGRPAPVRTIAPATPPQDTAWKIAGRVSEMEEIERVRVLQFCERVLDQRKQVAA